MATLFEITQEFELLYEMGADPDCDEEAFEGTLEALTGELEVKAKGYVAVMKQLEMEQKQAEEVSKAFAEKAKTRKNHITRMKDALKMAMETADLKSIEAGAFTVKIAGNGGKEPLKITGDVPDNMMRIVMEPDTEKIRDYVTEHPECEWAHIEPRGTHIVIK